MVRPSINADNLAKMIDKTGAISNSFDKDTDYQLQMGRYYNHDGIVTNSDNQNIIYDEKYNQVIKLEEFHNGSAKGSRILFNYSTKYLLLDNDNGPGLCVFDVSGKKLFEQKLIPTNTMDTNFKIGITDDYIVVYRKNNDVQTAALFNFDAVLYLTINIKIFIQ